LLRWSAQQRCKASGGVYKHRTQNRRWFIWMILEVVVRGYIHPNMFNL